MELCESGVFFIQSADNVLPSHKASHLFLLPSFLKGILNYFKKEISKAGSTCNLHFEINKIQILYIIAMLIVARHRIVLLDATVLSFKSLVHFDKR